MALLKSQVQRTRDAIERFTAGALERAREAQDHGAPIFELRVVTPLTAIGGPSNTAALAAVESVGWQVSQASYIYNPEGDLLSVYLFRRQAGYEADGTHAGASMELGEGNIKVVTATNPVEVFSPEPITPSPDRVTSSATEAMPEGEPEHELTVSTESNVSYEPAPTTEPMPTFEADPGLESPWKSAEPEAIEDQVQQPGDEQHGVWTVEPQQPFGGR